MDCQVATFFNCNPQVAISEMVGDFPCREEVFEAKTTSDFKQLVSAMPICPPSQSPSSFISLLLQKSARDSLVHIGSHITAAHLLIIICGALI